MIVLRLSCVKKVDYSRQVFRSRYAANHMASVEPPLAG